MYGKYFAVKESSCCFKQNLNDPTLMFILLLLLNTMFLQDGATQKVSHILLRRLGSEAMMATSRTCLCKHIP